MDSVAVLVFVLVVMASAILVYFYWLRHHSELPAAREQFADAIKRQQDKGALRKLGEDAAHGKAAIFNKRKQRRLYILTGVSAIAGPLFTILVRALGAGVFLRTVVGLLAILPFIVLVSIVIAEESDENNILRFERTTGSLLLAQLDGGATDIVIPELNIQAPTSADPGRTF